MIHCLVDLLMIGVKRVYAMCNRWLIPTSIIPASWEFFKPSRIAYNAYHTLTTSTTDCGSSPPRFCAELSGAPLTSMNIAYVIQTPLMDHLQLPIVDHVTMYVWYLFSVNDYLNLKIFPSSVIYFTWLLVVPLLSIIALEFKFVRRILSKKVPYFTPKSIPHFA
jgi:hypothetical protein